MHAYSGVPLEYLCDVGFKVWSLFPQVSVRFFDDRLHRFPGAEVVQALVVQRQKRAVRVLNLNGRAGRWTEKRQKGEDDAGASSEERGARSEVRARQETYGEERNVVQRQLLPDRMRWGVGAGSGVAVRGLYEKQQNTMIQ